MKHLKLEGARRGGRGLLPPLQHPDQKAERLDHPANGADGALAAVHEVAVGDDLALGGLRPLVIPAIDAPTGGQIGQQVGGARPG